MRLRSNSYHMLLSSLPALPPRFDVDRLPITFERLQGRLRLLEPEDAIEMDRLLKAITWSEKFAESQDTAVVQRYGEVMAELTTPLAREVLTASMDARMVLTALRGRRLGLGPPPVGCGTWFGHIVRNYLKPDLALGYVFPWILRCNELLAAGDLPGLHRLLLEVSWKYLKRRADDFYFSFEAVVLYVARLDVIRRWQGREPERGRAVFEALVTEALGPYANLSF